MPHRPPPHHRHVSSSAIASLLDRDRISTLLERWVPDAEDRRFIVRCLLDEGPAHHRGANYVLLALLGEAIDARESSRKGSGGAGEETIAVRMRLPPHLADERDDDEREFPLRFPKAPLERLAKEGTPAFEAMVDCLTDGPPHHALANAAMVCLLASLLDKKGGR